MVYIGVPDTKTQASQGSNLATIAQTSIYPAETLHTLLLHCFHQLSYLKYLPPAPQYSVYPYPLLKLSPFWVHLPISTFPLHQVLASCPHVHAFHFSTSPNLSTVSRYITAPSVLPMILAMTTPVHFFIYVHTFFQAKLSTWGTLSIISRMAHTVLIPPLTQSSTNFLLPPPTPQ